MSPAANEVGQCSTFCFSTRTEFRVYGVLQSGEHIRLSDSHIHDVILHYGAEIGFVYTRFRIRLFRCLIVWMDGWYVAIRNNRVCMGADRVQQMGESKEKRR